jgi:hypothetical protein
LTQHFLPFFRYQLSSEINIFFAQNAINCIVVVVGEEERRGERKKRVKLNGE